MEQRAGERCDLCECFANDGQLGVLHANWEHGSRHAGERYRVQLCEGCFFQSLSYIRQEREIQHLFSDEPLDEREFGLIGTEGNLGADRSIQLDIPNADAEALLRFVKQANARELCSSDPWESSRLESALEALAEALEASLK
ncbi:hypothetical protein IB229_12270 [Pseudomonas sp. PDM14]|uniref:hypothetical protein n=1 Tax=Pseudomonas sp. PDM14 TaxID=2769288 RepID=UPI00177B0DFA|nr:hypothetical protein [Pseudomonas sp. PDM14]MBD9483754.1 hypothetical protein [Pseudomonas sp. PDM14]